MAPKNQNSWRNKLLWGVITDMIAIYVSGFATQLYQLGESKSSSFDPSDNIIKAPKNNNIQETSLLRKGGHHHSRHHLL